jgi:hypothetical protein
MVELKADLLVVSSAALWAAHLVGSWAAPLAAQRVETMADQLAASLVALWAGMKAG